MVTSYQIIKFVFAVFVVSQLVIATVPVIFDTDYGAPIDDTFALSYILKKQCDDTFDIRLISVVGRNTTSRSTLIAKFLQESGYSNDADIGIGIPGNCKGYYVNYSINCVGSVWPWMDKFGDWSLENDYDGKIYDNGIDRMIEIIDEYNETHPIYVIAVGAQTNIATVLSLRPDLRKNIKLFTVAGSLFHDTPPFGKFAEFNIVDDIEAAQIVFNQRDKYPICSVPWDTGFYNQIKDEQYQRLLDAMDDDLLIKNMMDQYSAWYYNGGHLFDENDGEHAFHPNNKTTSLYDLELVWLSAYVASLNECDEAAKTCESVEFIEMQGFDIKINNTGYVVDLDLNNPNDANMSTVYFAAKWNKPNGLKGFQEDVVDTLLQRKCRHKTSKN